MEGGTGSGVNDPRALRLPDPDPGGRGISLVIFPGEQPLGSAQVVKQHCFLLGQEGEWGDLGAEPWQREGL